MKDALVEIGVLTRPHGVRGQVKLQLHNPTSTALGPGRRAVTLITDERRWGCELEVTAVTGNLLVVRLEGIDDRDAAESVRGTRVMVPRAELDPPGEGEYYYTDLIGCRVVDEQLGDVGRVHDVFEAGASDVLVVRKGEGEGDRECYLPLVEQWVIEVDLESRRITVRGIEQWDSWPV